MPTIPSFLSDIASQAQSAIQGQHGASASANQEGGSGKSHTLQALQHQLRQFGQQYSSTTPVQRIITTGKGIALDFDSISGDAKAHSKEIYMWGQQEDVDVKDVTDRLAFMNFVQGSLAGTLATKLDGSRAPFKALRDAEANLTPKRNIRAGLRTQIDRLQHGQEKGYEKRLADLKEQLAKLEREDEPQEKQIQLLKRQAIRDSETAKWSAVREYAEKLALVAQASSLVIDALPTLPPTTAQAYTGAQKTASARASLQRALDHYATGKISLEPRGDTADASDTRSFGESHANELSDIQTRDPSSALVPGIPVTPPSDEKKSFLPPGGPPPAQAGSGIASSSPAVTSPPALDPSALNHEPAPIPLSPPVSSLPPAVAADPATSATMPVTSSPTVAEVGNVVTSGKDGPGPASGSLKDIRQAHQSSATSTSTSAYGSPGAFASAEEEKKRLEREDRERVLAGASQAAPHQETAEEEKKRLEREERERVLAAAAGGTTGGQPPSSGNDDELPPYQEPTLQ